MSFRIIRSYQKFASESGCKWRNIRFHADAHSNTADYVSLLAIITFAGRLGVWGNMFRVSITGQDRDDSIHITEFSFEKMNKFA